MKPIAQILDAFRSLREHRAPAAPTDQALAELIREAVTALEEAELSEAAHSSPTSKPIDKAKAFLTEAIKLHQAHMDGSEPTSAASQKRLMDLLVKALDVLPGMGGGIAMAESDIPRENGDGLEEAELVGEIVPLIEKAVRQDGTFPIRIIAPGWGSSGYYSKQVLERDIPKVFPAGTHMHFDHPTVSEAKERPERSVKTIAAVTSSLPVWQDNGPAGPGMYAEAKARSQYRSDIEELAPHIGVSIVASGHRKTGIAEGRKGPVIESIHAGGSIDFVTQAGAGGQVISLFEAARSRAISEPITEVDDVSDQELKEAREALAAAQKEASDALAEAARLREGAILREARDVVATALAKVENLPDITRDRLLEAIAKNPPIADGKLDAGALETQVSEAVRAEVEYLAKVTGSGRITGMGGAGSTTDAAVKESEDRIGAALARGFGLTEAETKQAVAGRSN